MSRRVELVLPWDVLIRDNAKYGVYKGKMILTAAYRDAKEAAHQLALGAVKDRPAFTVPVTLDAQVYFPNSSRKRDAGNYRKLVTDALQGVVYPDDSLIHDERWRNAGVDPTNPRVEITIERAA